MIKDLPGVGQNLWEQITFNVLQGMNTTTGDTFVASPDPSVRQATLKQYQKDQAGPYSQAGGYFSFEKIPDALRNNFSQGTRDKLAKFPTDWPEVQYIPFAFLVSNSTIGSMSATLTAPLSRGNVTISSSSMTDAPVIDLAWLTDPADAEVAVAAFRRCREAVADSSLDTVRVGPRERTW